MIQSLIGSANKYNITGFFTCLFIILTLYSCGQKPIENSNLELAMKRMDTLEFMLTENKKMLALDIDMFNERKESMVDVLSQLKSIKPTAEEAEQIDKYNNIFRFYKKSEKRYKSVVMNTEELVLSVKALRQATVKKKYENAYDDFKREYSTLKRDLQINYENAKQFEQLTKTMEPDFLRSEKEITKILNKYGK